MNKMKKRRYKQGRKRMRNVAEEDARRRNKTSSRGDEAEVELRRREGRNRKEEKEKERRELGASRGGKCEGREDEPEVE